MNIEIKDFSGTHKLCVVTTKRGYSYACLWAMEKGDNGKILSPTPQQVKDAWQSNRRSFDKYNGIYMY